MNAAPAVPCDRCGTFTEPAAFILSRGKRLCPACRALELKSMRLWSPLLIAAVGTLMPPAGWVLAAADWWRLGLRTRVLLPVGAVVVRTALQFAASRFLYAFVPAGLAPVPSWALACALNLASVLFATAGLSAHVKAQREAGGQSASWIIALGWVVLPLFCFVGAYQIFSRS